MTLSLSSVGTVFQQQLTQFLATTQAKQLLVAFSGGLDSSALLVLAAEYARRHQLQLQAVHINHQLSPNADAWAMHCQQFCQQRQIPLECINVKITTASRTSLEAQAREARYRALAGCMQTNTLLLAGQHQDDQVETLLLQLKRGAGPKGLAAMPALKPFASGWIGRPLLSLSRQALQEWALAQRLNWIDDESNDSLAFDRNFIRHRILPELKQRWPGVERAISRSADLCAENQDLVEQLAQLDLAQTEQDGCLQLTALKQLTPARQRNLLRFWLAQREVVMPPAARLLSFIAQLQQLKPDRHPEMVWHNWRLVAYAGSLYLTPAKLQTPPTQALGWCGESEIVLPRRLGKLLFKAEPAALATTMLRESGPDEVVTIRFGVDSVRSCPTDRPGYRPLSKRMHERRIPPWLRQRIPLIYFGDKLAAVAGYWTEKGFAADSGKTGWSVTWEQDVG